MPPLRMVTLAAILAAAATAAPAVPLDYATGVGAFPQGRIAPDRADPTAALGQPDGDFLSLGLGGFADFTFGAPFTGPAAIFEITLGDRAAYPESVEVLGGTGGIFTSLATLGNDAANIDNAVPLTFAGTFDVLRLRDTTPAGSPSTDGFDVDAVSVAAIPQPAAAWLLAGAVGLLGLIGRKRRHR